jgi:hypothetical protein
VQRVQVGLADLLRRFQGAAAAEHRKPREETLLLLVQQVVRPFDGAAQRPLALGEVSGATCEEREPLLQPFQDLGGRERLDARGSELER